jgi:hypothetical protein
MEVEKSAFVQKKIFAVLWLFYATGMIASMKQYQLLVSHS